MRIAIVDDEKYNVNDIHKKIDSMNQGLQIVDVFYDGESFFNAFKVKKYDLVYLDSKMNDMKENSFVCEIKNINEDVLIILLTTQKYEKDVTDVFQYLHKPIDDGEFHAGFIRALRYHQSKTQRMIFKTYRGTYFIPVNDIICLETAYKNYKLYTVDDVYYGSVKQLADMRQKLCEFDFMQIHRSFTINLNYVQRMVYRDIYLVNGKIVPISRTKVKEFKNLFMKHVEDE